MLQAHCKWEISNEFSYGRAMLGHRKWLTMKPSPKSGPAADSKKRASRYPGTDRGIGKLQPRGTEEGTGSTGGFGKARGARAYPTAIAPPATRAMGGSQGTRCCRRSNCRFCAGQCFERSRRRRPMAGSRGIGRFGPRCPATVVSSIDGTEQKRLVMRRRTPCLSRFT